MVDVIELERQMKMKDEGGEVKMYEKDQLSREGWIMLLSGEINNEEMKLFQLENHGNVILLTLLLGGVAVVGVATVKIGMVLDALLYFILIFEGLMITFALYWRNRYSRVEKKSLILINIRKTIISGELTDLNEIHGIWKEYIKKYYRKLLEKSEMDEEEKELNEGEEKSEEKGSGKNINEQKEVLQAMQRDISNSSQKITRILGIERTKFVNYLSVVGGFTAAAGLALIVTLIGIYFSLTLGSSAIEYILVFSGVFLLGFGALMIRGTYQELPQKELFSIKKKLLHYAIIAFCVSVSIVVLFFILFLIW